MSKPLPVLSNMPRHIKERIVESIDILSRCSLRKCSQELRFVVDRSKGRLVWIDLKLGGSMVLITIKPDGSNVKTLVYTANGEDSCLIRGTLIEGMCHVSRAVSDLAAILKSPRIVVDLLNIEKHGERDNGIFLNAMRHSFGPFAHKLNIRHFRCHVKLSPERQSTMLSYLTPDILESFTLRSLDENQETSGLVEMEQWKWAKVMWMIDQSNFSIRQLLQFGIVTIRECRMTTEDLELVIENFVQNDSVDYPWVMNCRRMLHYDSIIEHLKQRAMRQGVDNNYLLEVPGAQFYVNIKLSGSLFVASKVQLTELAKWCQENKR